MADLSLQQAQDFYRSYQQQQAAVPRLTLIKAQPVPPAPRTKPQDPLQRAAKAWGQYAKAADLFETRALRTHSADDMRKAVVYRSNANKLMGFLQSKELVKGYPIPKKMKWRGMDVSIENPAGSVRNWHDPSNGTAGFTFMMQDYGYLRGTTGADRDHVDVFMGPFADTAQMVYVVRQMKAPNFAYYDEDKCMIGYKDEDAARAMYLAHYDNPKFLGRIDAFPVDAFLRAVKATKKAPAPVGGWGGILVQSRVSDLRELLPESILRRMDDRDIQDPNYGRVAERAPDLLSEARGLDMTHYTDPVTRA